MCGSGTANYSIDKDPMHQCTPKRTVQILDSSVPNACKDAKKWEAPFIAAENVKFYSQFVGFCWN